MNAARAERLLGWRAISSRRRVSLQQYSIHVTPLAGTLSPSADESRDRAAEAAAAAATPAETTESSFGPQSALRLTLLENSEKKTLELYVAAESAIAFERWLGLLRGRIVSDEGTEYGEWSALRQLPAHNQTQPSLSRALSSVQFSSLAVQTCSDSTRLVCVCRPAAGAREVRVRGAGGGRAGPLRRRPRVRHAQDERRYASASSRMPRALLGHTLVVQSSPRCVQYSCTRTYTDRKFSTLYECYGCTVGWYQGTKELVEQSEPGSEEGCGWFRASCVEAIPNEQTRMKRIVCSNSTLTLPDPCKQSSCWIDGLMSRSRREL